MRFGLRTIKTAVAAPIALLLAEITHLSSPTAAAIITILSVSNTKRSTLQTAINRMLSLSLATGISAACFLLLGFHPLAFGCYLLLFIPLSVKFGLGEGIAVSSVLVTHYLSNGSMPLSLLINEYLLMIIALFCALAVNLYMPDTEKALRQDQLVVEVSLKKFLSQMSEYLNQSEKEGQLLEECLSLGRFVKEAQRRAQRFEENRFLAQNRYYFEYFAMRRLQIKVLSDMLRILNKLNVNESEASELRELFTFTSETLAEHNDGQVILQKIAETYERYRQKSLPENRQAFENRAMLFQLFQLFKEFIEIKAGFSREKAKNS